MHAPQPAGASAGDVRRRNLLALLDALRGQPTMSRVQLAGRTGLSVPSVHRLVADLVAMGWVEPTDDASSVPRQGRPTTWLRFRGELAGIVGVDVGSQTTRFSFGSLSGELESTLHVPTDDLHDDPAKTLAAIIRRAHPPGRTGSRPLASVAVGVPSVVDAAGVLVRPWRKDRWTNLPLRAQLSRRLGCAVTVAQDNHFSALAEASPHGTAPGASSMLVVELGIGIGAGLALGGGFVTGAHGGLGRLMGWPCRAPRGAGHLGADLGELVTAGGLVSQYRWRGGSRRLSGGAELMEAAASGDQTAATVVRWAGRELGDVLTRLAMVLDPEVIVLGGGLGRGLHGAGLVPPLVAGPGRPAPELRSSRLGPDAVVTGALLAAEERVPAWIAGQIEAD